MAQIRQPDGKFGGSDKDITKDDVRRAVNVVNDFVKSKQVDVRVTTPLKHDIDVGSVDVYVHTDDDFVDIFLKLAAGLLATMGIAYLMLRIVML